MRGLEKARTLISVKEAWIFVDNLRLGGYQRLALDQAYALSDFGFRVTLFVLSPAKEWNFYELERNILAEKKVELVELIPSRRSLILSLNPRLSCLKSPLILSHSLRASFSLRILRFFRRNRYTINTTIHQLPGLTDPRQRFKRLVYAQFSDNLFCFSGAVAQSWPEQFGSHFSKIIGRCSKRIDVLRNGIYLQRLPSMPVLNARSRRPRIVFLGRLTFWKGLGTLQQLALNEDLQGFDFMFIVPDEDNESFSLLLDTLGDRGIVVRGKTVASYTPMRGDVHVYPANYGSEVKVIEGISLNCLEMGAIGIPSLITAGGLVTWEELICSDLYKEIDWGVKTDVAQLILNTSENVISEQDVRRVQSVVSIENQLKSLGIKA